MRIKKPIYRKEIGLNTIFSAEERIIYDYNKIVFNKDYYVQHIFLVYLNDNLFRAFSVVKL